MDDGFGKNFATNEGVQVFTTRDLAVELAAVETLKPLHAWGIYRIVYQGDPGAGAAAATPCPSADAPAGPIMAASAKPPEGVDPNAGAGAAAHMPVPDGATQAMVVLGGRIYRGEVGGAGCTGCHGGDGGGTPLGPTLKAHQWLWSDGSYAGIQHTITEGVANPKRYRSPMPAMGGAQLSPQQVAAVAAYVWGLSR